MKPDLTALNINAKPVATPPTRLTEATAPQWQRYTCTILVRNSRTKAKAEARA
jgi:hypothetical protein